MFKVTVNVLSSQPPTVLCTRPAGENFSFSKSWMFSFFSLSFLLLFFVRGICDQRDIYRHFDCLPSSSFIFRASDKYFIQRFYYDLSYFFPRIRRCVPGQTELYLPLSCESLLVIFFFLSCFAIIKILANESFPPRSTLLARTLRHNGRLRRGRSSQIYGGNARNVPDKWRRSAIPEC